MSKFFIYHGDALQILDAIAPNSVDVCYTSPAPAFFELQKGSPNRELDILGTEDDTGKYSQHLLTILSKVDRVLKPEGSLWLQIADYHSTKGGVMMVPEQIAINLIRIGWQLISPCIWARADRAVIVGDDRRRFVKDWEYIYWFTKSSDYYFNEDCGVNATSIFEYPYIKPKTPFESGYPIELIDIAIKATCPENGIVLDPFCGSGTTGVSALKNKRIFIGIEIIPEIANMTKDRLAYIY